MKVKFIVKGNNQWPSWEGDLQNIPFKKGDTVDIFAFQHIRGEDGLEKEVIQPLNGIFKVVEIVHRLTFEFVLSQNTTYNECIIYLNKGV